MTMQTLLKTIVASSLLLVALCAHAQVIKYDTPMALTGGVNTTAEESLPLLSEDGQKLYFVRTLFEENTGGKYAGQDIWVSNRNADGTWSKPTNQVFNWNNKYNNAFIGSEGNTAYLINSYRRKESKRLYISSSTFNASESDPDPTELKLKPLYPEDRYFGAFVGGNGKAIVLSMRTGTSLGQEDLYVLLYNEEKERYDQLIQLDSTINTSGFEISPYLSKDGTKLYFASNGHKGQGDSDIYVCERLDDSYANWSAPKNLGPTINSPKFDAYFSEGQNDEVFFVSTRNGGLADIFVTRPYVEKVPEEPKVEAPVVEKPQPEVTKVDPPKEEKVVLPTTDKYYIFFGFDSYILTRASKAVLDDVIDMLANNPGLEVVVSGHTDDKGAEAYNLTLSERRAKVAQQYLMLSGILDSQTLLQYFGETKPQVSNDTAEGRAKNRRVELRLRISSDE